VLDPTENCPAAQAGAKQIVGDFKDELAILKLAEQSDIITYEIESGNTDVLSKLKAKIEPSPSTLGIIQDKFSQKTFLSENELPVSQFYEITSLVDLHEKIKELGLPVLLKSRRDAYDGRGNFKIISSDEIEKAYHHFDGKSLMVEKFVDFKMEVSVIATRNTKGNIVTYPLVENIHENNILKTAFTFSGQGIILNKENTVGILVRSYLKNDIHKIELIKKGIIAGSLELFNKNTLSIGKELAISLDLIVGDEITLMSTSNLQTPFGNLPLQEKFTISSVFSTGLAEFDQNVIFMPFENANSLFELSDLDIDLEIFLNKPDKVRLIQDRLQKIFSDHYVYSWADLNKSFFGALKVERNVMFIILTLIIIVAAFNIISGLTILVKNKTKEIAILRTLGISKNSIAKIFFLTGFTIGLLATITGVTIGILFSYYIEEIRVLITSIFNIRLCLKCENNVKNKLK